MTQFYVEQERPHLGGYIPGGDPATYYPQLWYWLVKELGVQSMIDIGCGEGHALAYFRDLGCRVHGIDGVRNEGVYQWDFTEGAPPPTGPFDLAWSCEFVEHVAERYIPNFVSVFKVAPLVLMTHADVGQPGHHHVNCQPSAYWQGVMAAAGYTLDGDLTLRTREFALLNQNPINHYARSGLAFRRL